MQDITIISLIFTVALALVSLFLILAPFFKWDAYLHAMPKNQDLASVKEALLTTLNELEFEYKMDKISHTDYKTLKKQYESEVAKVMKEEEQVTSSRVDEDLMSEVEREIVAHLKSYKKKEEGK